MTATGHAHQHSPSDLGSATATATDPVCGMQVDPHKTQHRATHQGRPYYFCSAGCRAKFTTTPDKYLAPQADQKAPASVPAGTIYTCPMHPQIRQPGPGNCPICGMALEPELVTADAGPQSRARRHEAAVLDRSRPRAAGLRARDGSHTFSTCTC